MGTRRHISDISEEQTSITFALVIRTENNLETFGGGYVRLQKPIQEADLDGAVQKLVEEGDNAFKKKLTDADRAALNPIPATAESGRLLELARSKNRVDWPQLGMRAR